MSDEYVRWEPDDNDPCHFTGYVYSDFAEPDSSKSLLIRKAFWAGVKWGRDESKSIMGEKVAELKVVERLREYLTDLRQEAEDCDLKSLVMICDEALEVEE